MFQMASVGPMLGQVHHFRTLLCTRTRSSTRLTAILTKRSRIYARDFPTSARWRCLLTCQRAIIQ